MKQAPHLFTLVMLTAMTVISTTMFLPALPAMQADFGVSADVIGLAVSAYMVVAAAMQLVLGPLSDRVGRRPVVLGVLAVYAVASLVCAATQDIVVFLLARSVQSVAMAGGILVAAMVRDGHDGPEAAARLATIASAMAVVPLMAPVLGGAMALHFGWRAIFLLYGGIGLGLLAWSFRDLGETRQAVAAGTRERPVALLREARFWAYAACQALGAGGFYVFLLGSPFVVVALYDLNSAEIGIGLGSVTAGFALSAALSARLVRKVGPFPLIVVGRLASLAGLGAGLVIFALGTPSVWAFYAVTVWIGVGNGLTMANANVLALSVRPRLAGTASGIAGAMGNMTIAALSTVTTFVLSDGALAVRLLLLLFAVVSLSLAAVLIGHRLERAAVGQAPGEET